MKIKLKKDWLTCEGCGKTKEDVDSVECPYAKEIHEEDVPITVCDDCYCERAEDI